MHPSDTTSRAELEAALLRRLRGGSPAIPRLPRPPGPARFPASPAQAEACARAWRDPARPDRVVLTGLRLRGPLDVPALERALAAVVRRHETLRTVFEPAGDGLVQVIHPVPAVPVTVVEATEDDFAAQTLAALEPPMNLRTGPLIRFRLLRLAADEHIAIVVLHHVIADARATEVLLADLAEAYLGADLAPLPIQYADFVVWQRDQPGRAAAVAAKVEYWRTRLAGARAVPIPADSPPSDGPAHRGDLLAVGVPDDLFARLRAFARARDTTVFVTTLAAFQVLLARLGGTRDVAVSVPVTLRDRAEVEGLIADFSQAVVSRLDLAGDPSFETVLATARDRFAEDLDHAGVPRDPVVRELPGHAAELFDRVEFGVDRETATDGSGLDLEPLPPRWPYAERPLTVRVGHDEEHATLYVTYRCRDFSRARAADLAEDYLTVLAGCLHDPAAGLFGPGAPALRIGRP
ncbi:condensation domain-containing protein [Amycolatopsis sp. DG1A-15b]|uniref:condensation domain-containing protein n=1 Tax=Amycolatopsis sp. DG1A-15b TaxID=3052846 RepID=UPI00255BA4A7|nr:condensation domain-containing protein [Amycolatopsis sp. DG1A-15b]WIX93016.1 condensation domain-containing protein [Amycolatopsis sp. DG1A-15b]